VAYYKYWYSVMGRVFGNLCKKFPAKSTPNLMERACMEMNERFLGFRAGFDHSHVVEALEWKRKRGK
jgi:hypothetical protein